MSTDDTPKTLTSIEKTLSIIEALWKLDGAGVTELADHLDMSKSTAHAHLATLARNGFVVSGDDQYELGLRFVNFGEYVKRSQSLYTVTQPVVEEVAEKTGERVFCMVEQHGLATALCVAAGDRSVQTDIRVGTHSYMHCSSSGKAILAHLPHPRVEEILDRWGLKQFTENTITDRERLYDELRAGRDRGYFFNREEYRTGVTAIGVPIVDDGDVRGAVSLSGPAMRLEGDWHQRDLPSRLLSAANAIEVDLSFNR
ncbi:IclR family transcriptional regulator [Halocatena pleomorpha]|uniref:IclR family transcriptional regulator n=1 Tax=Halocatena pleomorpha TaxID=1785090 RepID=A0A3P3RBN7_9EURY|nr:IclR family transcriptional regulator [Halocatena pleomorpha]RRJ30120.1 IclR family transcriptional regulator [Halocatena pleomorpha]